MKKERHTKWSDFHERNFSGADAEMVVKGGDIDG